MQSAAYPVSHTPTWRQGLEFLLMWPLYVAGGRCGLLCCFGMRLSVFVRSIRPLLLHPGPEASCGALRHALRQLSGRIPGKCCACSSEGLTKTRDASAFERDTLLLFRLVLLGIPDDSAPDNVPRLRRALWFFAAGSFWSRRRSSLSARHHHDAQHHGLHDHQNPAALTAPSQNDSCEIPTRALSD